MHPRFPRCSCFASTTQRIQSRGHSPRTFFTGAPTLSVIPRREGVEARPYDGWRGILSSPTLHQPLSHGPSGRDSSPFRGAERAGCGAPTLFVHPRRPQPLSRGAPLTPRLFFLRLCPLLWGSWPWSSYTRVRRAWCWHRARRPRRRRRARPRRRGGLSWRRPRPGPGP